MDHNLEEKKEKRHKLCVVSQILCVLCSSSSLYSSRVHQKMKCTHTGTTNNPGDLLHPKLPMLASCFLGVVLCVIFHVNSMVVRVFSLCCRQCYVCTCIYAALLSPLECENGDGLDCHGSRQQDRRCYSLFHLYYFLKLFAII
ncbi:hypothetical protein DAI22_04g032600 [Oryza sativa Japonica Group]|nr:hypothetical protein DAI22_04g032600 [Oryza sativa Japonica Group]